MSSIKQLVDDVAVNALSISKRMRCVMMRLVLQRVKQSEGHACIMRAHL